MKLIPKYSYEYNCILNEKYEELDQIKNFASLLSDKDRFLALITQIEKNKKIIEEISGFKLNKNQEFHVVRAEKFKSFSEPITIENSLIPEEMLLFLLKEIIKITASETRFPDDISREKHISAFIEFILLEGTFNQNLIEHVEILHNESKKLFDEYEPKDIDFKKSTLKKLIENLYD